MGFGVWDWGFGISYFSSKYTLWPLSNVSKIWKFGKKARLLENKIFLLTKTNPLSKDFSIKDQMNRSAGAIMDNIAEGFGRGSRLEFIQFLTISRGSGAELQSQLYRCLDRNYFSSLAFEDLYADSDNVCKMLTGFIAYLNKSMIQGQKFKARSK